MTGEIGEFQVLGGSAAHSHKARRVVCPPKVNVCVCYGKSPKCNSPKC
jgi:hypothetical protein